MDGDPCRAIFNKQVRIPKIMLLGSNPGLICALAWKSVQGIGAPFGPGHRPQFQFGSRLGFVLLFFCSNGLFVYPPASFFFFRASTEAFPVPVADCYVLDRLGQDFAYEMCVGREPSKQMVTY